MSEKEQFRDKFTVTVVDPDGKKFDRVKRIVARSEELEMYMQLDINTEIYPIHVGEKFSMALASTLNLDGTPDSGYFMQGGRKSLADEFEYVMQGKLYKISDKKKNGKVDMLASFGGLLMHLEGDSGVSSKFELDQRLFILIKKI